MVFSDAERRTCRKSVAKRIEEEKIWMRPPQATAAGGISQNPSSSSSRTNKLVDEQARKLLRSLADGTKWTDGEWTIAPVAGKPGQWTASRTVSPGGEEEDVVDDEEEFRDALERLANAVFLHSF